MKRRTRVLNHRLEEAHWLAGDEYSMADIITFPWIRAAAQSGVRFAQRGSIDVNEYPAVKRWYDETAARPAVQRGLAVLADHQSDRQISDTERENTFGATQFGRSVTVEATDPIGSPKKSLSDAQFAAKFRDCARNAVQPLSDASVAAALTAIGRLETLADARELMAPFAG